MTPTHKRLSQTCLWVFESLLYRHGSAVACHRNKGSGSSSLLTHGMCHKSSWKISSIAPRYSHQVGDPQTGSSPIVATFLYPTTDFPTWGSNKGTENPQGIELWRSAGFDYRTSTGLWKQRLLEGTNKTLCTPGPRGKSRDPTKDWARPACECLRVSSRGMGQQFPAPC